MSRRPEDVGAEKSRAHLALQTSLAAIVPPLIAFAIESLFWTTVTRWLLFNAAVIVSSWIGGLKSGIAATLLSTAFVWWYFVPPARTWGATDPNYYLTAILFVAIGISVSLIHEQQRRAKNEVAVALADLRRANELSERTGRANRIFAAFMENSPDFIGIADPTGKPTYVNPAGRRMVELPADLPIEITQISEYYPLGVRDFVSDVIMKSMIEQGQWTGETSFRNWRTDEPIPVLDSHFMIDDPETGQILGMGTITRDIRELKRTRDALEETASDLQEAQRVAHIGSWSWDIKTDTLHWSPELYRIHGRDPSLPPPNHHEALLELFTPESRTALTASTEKLMKDGLPFEIELETILPDGSTRSISVRGEVIRDASGQPVVVRGTSQDITQLKELQRMKEEWTSVIAHDLRQPIGVIKTSAELLPELHEGKMGDDEETITQRIRSGASALTRMVDDLLDVSRLEANRLSLQLVRVDPRTIVRETVDRLSHLAKDSTLVVSDDGELPRVSVDPGRLDQILGNLISNAAKYGEKNGEIHVQLKPHQDDVEISVTNQGRGIAPEELSTIFTRFIRSQSSRGSGVPGLGLGLYIAKGLVEAHGGRIWVDSTPNKTTTFHFTLPSRPALKQVA